MSDLMHYTSRPLEFDPARQYIQKDLRTFGKPVGFWVSVSGEDDWPSWCRGEEFGLNCLQFAQQVTLAAAANVLWISSGDDIDAFHEKWSIETEFERRYGTHGSWPIDWHKVALRYDGLIIAPYQYSRRFSPDWYYGWDCASGCIWNLAAIASVESVEVSV